jgi:hypothetical protein
VRPRLREKSFEAAALPRLHQLTLSSARIKALILSNPLYAKTARDYVDDCPQSMYLGGKIGAYESGSITIVAAEKPK